ncbi:hypothetical protein [Spongiivirga citrea]|uniref:DUF4293 family protein n=1 Tax=Spongiivirga citrea TaxID=1481457 RepID=A0A6M0CT69_9FLAO|nr:hypothetical protein [Spongiivirga citrea]NER18707.1 hypothetical protein [Spongiivirga citrea]
MKKIRLHKTLVIGIGISFLIYVGSLFLPMFSDDKHSSGLLGLMLGWSGFVDHKPFMAISWTANITFLLSILLYAMPTKRRFILSIITFGLSLFALGFEEFIFGEKGNIPGIAFFVWIFSFLTMIATFYIKWQQEKSLL